MSHKSKFIIMAISWLVGISVVGWLVVPEILSREEAAASKTLDTRKRLDEEIAEQDNLRRAENSLKLLAEQKIQPLDLLPREESIAEELKLLETWAANLELKFEVRISGNVPSFKRAETKSDIALAPAVIILRGGLGDTLAFLQALEQSSLPFIVNSADISADGSGQDGNIITSLSGNIYIQRK